MCQRYLVVRVSLFQGAGYWTSIRVAVNDTNLRVAV
jgi:hypothetical protein